MLNHRVQGYCSSMKRKVFGRTNSWFIHSLNTRQHVLLEVHLRSPQKEFKSGVRWKDTEILYKYIFVLERCFTSTHAAFTLRKGKQLRELFRCNEKRLTSNTPGSSGTIF